jgi:cytochrome c
MKKTVTILSLFVLASSALALEGASIEKGRELFTGTSLGSNGKSCNVCHADGSGISKAAVYEEKDLGEIINQCIKNPLAGEALGPDSVEMKSLILYIKSLAPSS